MASETTIKINAEDNASKEIKEVSESVKGLIELLGAEKLVEAMADASDEAATAESNFVKLQTAFNNTGTTIGVTAEDLKKLSEEISTTTGTSEELVTQSETILLSFTALNKDTFPATLKAAADLGAQWGMALPEAANLLGKAMENPANAARMLRAAHIDLTSAEKDELKAANDSGDIHKAQAIILEDVEKRYGGAAEAIRGTFKGAVMALNSEQEKLNESFGKTVNDALKPLVDIITGVIKWYNDLDSGTKTIISSTVAGAAAVSALILAIEGMGAALTALGPLMAANPMVIFVAAIGMAAAAVYGLVKAMNDADNQIALDTAKWNQGFNDFGNNIQVALVSAFSFIMKSMIGMINDGIHNLNGFIDQVNSALHTHFSLLSDAFEGSAQGWDKQVEKVKTYAKTQHDMYQDEINNLQDAIKHHGELSTAAQKSAQDQGAALDELTKKQQAAWQAELDMDNKLAIEYAKSTGDKEAIAKAEMDAKIDAITKVYDAAIASGVDQEEAAKKWLSQVDTIQATYTQSLSSEYAKRDADYTKSLDNQKKETDKAYSEIAHSAISAFSNIGSSIATIMQNTTASIQAQIATQDAGFDAQAQREIDTTGATGAAAQGIRDRYNKQKEEADREQAQKAYNMQVATFDVTQTLAVANAWIQAAAGVVAAMASPESVATAGVYGGIMSGIILASAGVQTGAILSQTPPAAPAFATGGIMPYTGMAMVGEQGPELVKLPGGSQVYSNSQSKAMTGGGDIHIHGPITVQANNMDEFNNSLNRLYRYQLGRA